MRKTIYSQITSKYENKKKEHIAYSENQYRICIDKIDKIFRGELDKYILHDLIINEDYTASYETDICHQSSGADITPKLHKYLKEKNDREQEFDKVYVTRRPRYEFDNDDGNTEFVYINIEFLNKEFFEKLSKKYN